MNGPLLEVCDLVVEYRGQGRGRSCLRAVDGVSLRIDEGMTLGVVGESGSGKSTLARAVLGLVDVHSGQIEFDGERMTRAGQAHWRRFRRDVQVVFQDPAASLDPRMNVAKILAEPLQVHRPGLGAAEAGNLARKRLRDVGLDTAHLQRFPRQLSGGECQRVAIARALMLEPRLLICDEPVSALDISIQAQILSLLRELQQRLGLAVMFIAHDLSVVRFLCQRVVVMFRGRVVEDARAEDLFGDPQHPYTRALLRSVPIADPRRRRNFAALPAAPAGAFARGGCVYAQRCPISRDICRTDTPLPVDREGSIVTCHFPGSKTRSTGQEEAGEMADR